METPLAPSTESVLSGAERNLKARLLLPLALALLALAAIFVFSLRHNEGKHLTGATGRDLATMQATLQDMVAARADKLRAALEMLERNGEFRADFKRRDRELLRAKYTPLFERLKDEFNITHFYVIDADRTALLRLHQPERHGDRIDRFTAVEAERTGRIAVGTELGPLGTLALRAVMPLFEDGRLLGYVELAEEVLDTVRNLSRTFGCECFVFIHKDRLLRQSWEEGMSMLGRQGEWERFPQSVLVAQTLPSVPAALARLSPEGVHSRLSSMGDIEHGGRTYQSGFIPLFDAAGREVGDLAVLRDVTADKAQTRRMLVAMVAASAALGVLLFLFFHRVMALAQHALADARRRFVDKAREHAELQQLRIEELAVRADEQRRINEEMRIAAIAFESQEGMFVTDAKGVILRVNRAFCALTGYATDEVVGRTPAMLRSGRHDAAFYERMWHTLLTEGHWEGEIWNRRKSGETFPEWQSITAVADEEGRISHFVSAFSDITLRKQAEAEIQRLAYYDHLTGLPNRRLLLDRLDRALATSARRGRHGALLFLDLDHFKTLNDTRGHEAGDQLLTEVARRLGGCVREGDTVARLGGDEFVVMLEDLSAERQGAAAQAEMVGRKIIDAVVRPCALMCNGDGKTIEHQCTASIGAIVFLGHEESVDDLLRHADLAMYKSKEAGRNTLRFFDPAMQVPIRPA